MVIAHNKTLADQFYEEFREFSLENAVEYFVTLIRCRNRIKINKNFCCTKFSAWYNNISRIDEAL